MIKTFREFLDALESPGGELLILLGCCLVSGVTALAESHRSSQVDDFMLAIFSGFSGALMKALTTRTKNGNGGVIQP